MPMFIFGIFWRFIGENCEKNNCNLRESSAYVFNLSFSAFAVHNVCFLSFALNKNNAKIELSQVFSVYTVSWM